MPKYILLFLFFIPFLASSQSDYLHRKGTFFVFWGYNRSAYPTSDIRFQGPGYDFTLAAVQASDAPTPFDGFQTYFNPSLFSIPQFNLHGGYFINDSWSISLGWDHMKYVMKPDQASHITGHIDAQVSNPQIPVNPSYVGNYSNNPFVIQSKDFLQYEHTDGYNYAALEVENYHPIWKKEKSNFQLDWINGVGIGAVVPRSDVRLFTVGTNNFWNLAGAGVSAKSGLRLNLTKLLFFEAMFKGGYTNLWEVHTTGRSVDHASQTIWFGEFYGALGFSIGKAK